MRRHFALLLFVLFVSTTLLGCSSNIYTGVATEDIETSALLPDNITSEEIERKESFPIKFLGTVYQLYDKDYPLINGGSLKMSSGLVGAGSHIQCIYEIGDSIDIRVDCPKEVELYVSITPHNEDSSVYDDDFFENYGSGYTNKFLYFADSGYLWVNLSSMSRVHEPGYYDLVFMVKKKPVAVIMIKLFEEGYFANTTRNIKDIQESEIQKTVLGE